MEQQTWQKFGVLNTHIFKYKIYAKISNLNLYCHGTMVVYISENPQISKRNHTY